MAIDVIIAEQLHDRGELVHRLPDEALDLLGPVFADFERRTGRRIDSCGRTPFPHGTLIPLIATLREWLNRSDISAQARAIRKLLAVLVSADEDRVGVIFDGE